ncbi:MAG: GtrA family protein [Daejeonella sp.]
MKGKMPGMNSGKALHTFVKAQVSAFTGGVCDYMIMIGLTELTGMHYAFSIMFGGILGAVINFSINRYWAFSTGENLRLPLGSQLARFSLVVAGSILLKSFGTYLITSGLTLDYRISRLFVQAIVAYGFNYGLLRYWVFKPNEKQPVFVKVDATLMTEEE